MFLFSKVRCAPSSVAAWQIMRGHRFMPTGVASSQGLPAPESSSRDHDPIHNTIDLAHPTFTIWGANTGTSICSHYCRPSSNQNSIRTKRLEHSSHPIRFVLIVCNLHSGVGKTLFSIGLGRAFVKQQASVHEHAHACMHTCRPVVYLNSL